MEGAGVTTTDSATNKGESLREKMASRGRGGKGRTRSNHASSMSGGILAALPSNVMPSQRISSNTKRKGKHTSASGTNANGARLPFPTNQQHQQKLNKINIIMETWSDAGGESTPEKKHRNIAGEKTVIPGSPPPSNILISKLASSPVAKRDENFCNYEEHQENSNLTSPSNLSDVSGLTTPASEKKNNEHDCLASPNPIFQTTGATAALLLGGDQDSEINETDHCLLPRPLFQDDEDDRSPYGADVENISECGKIEDGYDEDSHVQSSSSSSSENKQESDDETEVEIITIEDEDDDKSCEESTVSSASLEEDEEEDELEIDDDESASSVAESCYIMSEEEGGIENTYNTSKNDDDNSEDYVPDENSDDSDEELEIDDDSSNDTPKLNHRRKGNYKNGASAKGHLRRLILDSDDEEDNYDKDDDSTITEDDEEESAHNNTTQYKVDPLAMTTASLLEGGDGKELFVMEWSNGLEDTRADDDDSKCHVSLKDCDSFSPSVDDDKSCSTRELTNKKEIDNASLEALLDKNMSFMDDMSASSSAHSSSTVLENATESVNNHSEVVAPVIISDVEVEKSPLKNGDNESSMEVMVDDEESFMNLTLSSTVLSSLVSTKNYESGAEVQLSASGVQQRITIVDVGHIEIDNQETGGESDDDSSIVAVADLDESFVHMTLTDTFHQTTNVSEEKLVQSKDDPAEDKPNDKENSVLLQASNEMSKGRDKEQETTHSISSREFSSLSLKEGSSKSSRPKTIRREGSVQLGKWSLGSKIGVGSFGVVHVGMNKQTGTLMAVKSVKLEKAVMKDIRREINLLRTLDHINIVRYLGAEMNASDLHIFQEWVPGGSVASLLQKFGPFSFPVVRSYLLQIIAGLAYLHKNNILHRDIKGGNVLVNDAGVVKLADFGASRKLAQQAFEMESLTMRGTPYFMAPEVFQEKYGAKADVWSVGCVAYQMTTGVPPWKEMGFTNPMALFVHLTKDEGPPALPEEWSSAAGNGTESPLFKALLEKCFARDPSIRPTAEGLLEYGFFTEIPADEDEQSPSRGLFSPGENSRESLSSPIMSPPNTAGGKPPRTPNEKLFASPPLLPSSVRYESLNSDAISPMLSTSIKSVKVDAKDWPTWAKGKLVASQQKSNKDVGASPATLGSLARSEDSSLNQENPFRRQPNTSLGSISPLNGLNFVVDDGF